MNINSNLSKAINNSMELQGVSFEFSSYLIDRISKYGFLNNVNQYIESDDIKTYLKGVPEIVDMNTYLHVFVKMLEEGAVDISFNEKASQKDIEYLKKISVDK